MQKLTLKSLSLLLVVAAIGCKTSQKTQKPSQPNIIYVLADDLGYGDLKAFNPNSKLPLPA